MSELIYIEPAHEHRPAFASWGLAQSPPLQTASAQGWEVPLDLYASIPAELLDGATVDGFPYGVASPQPESFPAPGKVQVTMDPGRSEDEAASETPKPRRKRAARKSSAQGDGRHGPTPEETVAAISGDTAGWGADA